MYLIFFLLFERVIKKIVIFMQFKCSNNLSTIAISGKSEYNVGSFITILILMFLV